MAARNFKYPDALDERMQAACREEGVNPSAYFRQAIQEKLERDSIRADIAAAAVKHERRMNELLSNQRWFGEFAMKQLALFLKYFPEPTGREAELAEGTFWKRYDDFQKRVEESYNGKIMVKTKGEVKECA